MKLTYTSVFSYLRLAVAGTLVVAAVGLGLSSLSVQSPRQFGEHHRGSAAFLKHTEDLFAARVGPAGESAAASGGRTRRWAELTGLMSRTPFSGQVRSAPSPMTPRTVRSTPVLAKTQRPATQKPAWAFTSRPTGAKHGLLSAAIRTLPTARRGRSR